jgi:hypothetical protein
MDANLEFDARDYDWMIISGARARFQGEGMVKGRSGLYKFRVTVLDSNVAGSGISADRFRIKIWQETPGGTESVLYDNGLGADESSGDGGTTPLGGGSITVHSNRK